MKKDQSFSYYGPLASLYYDAMEHYAPRDEVDFYARMIDENPGRVLEAMSGSGRIQIPLLQRGYVVDGVDASSAMLEHCRIRCQQLKLNPDLYLQSIEDLHIDKDYATVFIAFASFQLIADRDIALKALCKIREHMKIGGVLLIDLFVPDVVTNERAVSYARLDAHRVIRLTVRYLIDQEKKIVEALRWYELIVDGAVQDQEQELIQLTWYTHDEIIELLHQAGFEFVTSYKEQFRSSGPSHILHARAV